MNGDAEAFEDVSGNIGGSIGELPAHDYNMAHEDYQSMMSNKTRWWELFNAGNMQNSNAEMQNLNRMNDALRAKYGIPAGEYPKFHSGGQSLTAGWAQVLPGEIFFPPGFSKDLKTLIAVSSGITGKAANNNVVTTDNRKEIKIDKLLNIENNHMEDTIDGEILSRELQRAIIAIK